VRGRKEEKDEREEKDNERKSPMDLCSLEIPLGSYFGSRALNVKKGRISDVW